MARGDVSSRLGVACRRSGITLQGLARESGVQLETLKKIARGQRMPLTTTALRMATALGVEVEEIFGGGCRR